MVFDFLTETFDMDIYRPGLPTHGISPHVVQDLIPGQDDALVLQQQAEQLKLLQGQGDIRPVHLYHMAGGGYI